jgi:hypothetical protein
MLDPPEKVVNSIVAATVNPRGLGVLAELIMSFASPALAAPPKWCARMQTGARGAATNPALPAQ